MFARRLQGMMALSMGLLTAAPLGGCRKEHSAQSSRPPANPAEVKRLADSARQKLKEVEAPLAALSAQYRSLHERFDPLPPGLPEFGETRAQFYTAAIGVGTLSAKVPWLTRRIDEAVATGGPAELQEISEDVQHIHDEIRQAERLGVELLQRVQPFERRAEQKADELRLTGKAACE